MIGGNSKGLAILCNNQGTILQVIKDDLGLGRYLPDKPAFLSLINKDSIKKALEFLFNLHSYKVTFGWEMDVELEKPYKYYFCGSVIKGYLLIMAASDSAAMMNLYEELMKAETGLSSILALIEAQQELPTVVSFPLMNDLAKLSDDLTRLRQDLAKKNTILTKALQVRDEFLANISHELRTPLNGILGMCELLQEKHYGELTSSQQESITLISQSGGHLLNIINDLIDIARLEAGRLTLEYNSIYVPAFCRNIIHSLRPLTQKKPLEVSLTVQPNVKEMWADERCLRQVISNLLANAIKFTPPYGQIGLEVAADADKRTLLFTVWDTGIGISTEEIAELFQPFGQLDSSLSRRYEGVGLGLALCYRLIKLHSGEITVDSTRDKGSRFTVSIPWQLAARTRTPRAEISAKDLPTEKLYKVLLAEDDSANALAVSYYLKHKGHTVFEAKNGQEAVELAKLHHPDIILMDIRMPDIDGMTAIAEIRSCPEIAAIPIIAITAMIMEDRQECLNKGANEYICKPFKIKDLLDLIYKVAQ